MGFNGAHAEMELVRDLCVRVTEHDQLQHVELAVREVIRRSSDCLRLGRDARAELRVEVAVAPNRSMHCLDEFGIGRLLEDEAGTLVLNMNSHWRSRDAYKAAYMNIFALTDLQRIIARRVSERMGRPIRVGRYADLVDSFHIYGSYFDEFEGFLKMVEKRPWEERTWDSSYAEPVFAEAREKLAREKGR